LLKKKKKEGKDSIVFKKCQEAGVQGCKYSQKKGKKLFFLIRYEKNENERERGFAAGKGGNLFFSKRGPNLLLGRGAKGGDRQIPRAWKKIL